MNTVTTIIPLDQSSESTLSLESGLQEVGLNLQWLIHQAVLSLDPYLTDEEAVYGLDLAIVDHYAMCQFPYAVGAERSVVHGQFLQYRQLIHPYLIHCQHQYPHHQYRVNVEEVDQHGQLAIKLDLHFEDLDDLPPNESHRSDSELLAYLESGYREYVSTV